MNKIKNSKLNQDFHPYNSLTCVFGARFCSSSDISFKPEIQISSSYIRQFWVGLLEGDGSITVDQNKPSKLSRARLFISLKNLEKNRIMLNMIQKEIGGKVRVERNNSYVTWAIVSKKDIETALSILDEYPLLTTRRICQLEFLKKCIKDRDVNLYLQNRDYKYDKQREMTVLLNHKFIIPHYFPAWLSGFIEAEGHFSVYNVNGKIKPKSFTIGQNNDLFILEAIKYYFDSHHKICCSAGFAHKKNKQKIDYYRIDIYGQKIIQNIQNHFLTNPLLGDKQESYKK